MTSTFSFPILSPKDIVAILTESEIATINEQHLANPNLDLVGSIFTNILIYLDPLQENYGQADFDALGQLENPDLHVDSVRVMNLCHKIKEVMGLVACPIPFTLMDLLQPDSHRTQVFLSALLNFFLHRETKMERLQPSVVKLNFLEEQNLEKESRILQLEMELSNLKDASDREQPFIQELDGEVKKLRQTIQGLNNHQMLLKTSYRNLKEKLSGIDEKICSAEFQLVQSAQENAKLRSKIVQSPDKLQGALEEKKAILAKLKDEELKAMQSFEEKTAVYEAHSKALKNMSKHYAKMQSIQDQVNSAKMIDKDVKALKAKLNDQEVAFISLEAKVLELQRKKEQLEEFKKALEKDCHNKREEAGKELDHIKLEVESERRGLVVRQKKIEAKIAEADSIIKETNAVKESGAVAMQQLLHKAEEIVNEFHNYSHSIETCMGRAEAEGADLARQSVSVMDQ